MQSTLQQTVELLNSTSAEHVYALGSKIIGNLPQCTLNPGEAQSVANALGLPVERLNKLCDLIAWSFEMAALGTMNAEALMNKLTTEKGFGKEHATAICRVWNASGRSLVSKLQTQVLGSPTFVSDVQWRIELESSASSTVGGNKLRNPLVLFDFELQNAISQKKLEGQTASSSENLRFQVNKEQLLKLYDDLERIQMQLDSLTPQ
jgi:hypothetical protein